MVYCCCTHKRPKIKPLMATAKRPPNNVKEPSIFHTLHLKNVSVNFYLSLLKASFTASFSSGNMAMMFSSITPMILSNVLMSAIFSI